MLTIDTYDCWGQLRCVPRKLRIEYPGAMYHVMNRGDGGEDIFQDNEDRKRFLSTLGKACQKTGWQVHGYCLMRNHFHLVIETPQANLVAGMKWLLGVYSTRFNIRHNVCGHLFAGRYKALLVDGNGNDYLKLVCDYAHLNPVRAKLLRAGWALERFRWSSYGEYLKPARQRPAWLRVDRLLDGHGVAKDSAAGRKQFARQMERHRAVEAGADYRLIRRGWCLGSEAFRQKLLAAEARMGASHYEAERQATVELKAERIVREELKRLGWVKRDLPRRRKGDEGKVAVARRLHRETTVSLKWIAQRLQMGSWYYVSNLLNEGSRH